MSSNRTDDTPTEIVPTDEASTGLTVDSEYFENVLRLLKEVVQKQNQLEQRLNNEMVTKAEFAAHNKMLCEMKVATKKIEVCFCKMTGEGSDSIMDAIASMVPMTTMAAVLEVEEKWADPNYTQAMVLT
ncbi:uncharacterized protein LOC118735229 [Rhagoletis pomonella]|uniref:uncharacterized protein LOC118735229 n=1 Tax=Rhagoletis pomonella TaxID=28610 RepID=UPI001782BA2E|nr:uncharacterized protein LOC118735229 [Rhagoletis pomonella]